MPAIIIENLCVCCGQCVNVCPNGAISVTVKRALVDPGKCDDCEECVFACVNGAIAAGD
jgi:ferredoxin